MNTFPDFPESVFTMPESAFTFPEPVFTFNQNWCSRSSGMGVHDGPEYAGSSHGHQGG